MYLLEEAYISKDLPKGWAPYYIYSIMLDEVTQVGKLTLRTGSKQERYYDGHVGYSIDLLYRGHHYAYQALLLLQEIAREKGFQELLLTCSPENIASKKTILKLNVVYLETKRIPKEQQKYFLPEETIKEIYSWKL